MLSREQLQAVRKIQIRTSHLVSDLFAGRYHSAFKGRGMEFAEVRPYVPGDDVRAIDWNVTARTGSPHVKRFVEERELTVMLLVDASGSMRFSTRGQLESELAAELAAVFAFSAIANNDKVGLVIFTDRIELALPPRKGTRHVLRVIRDVLSHAPSARGTDLAGALDYLGKIAPRRCVVFLVSDFLDLDRAARALRVAARRHDLIAVVIEDRTHRELPALGLIAVRDPESGQEWTADLSDPGVRRRYAEQRAAQRAQRDRVLRAAGVDAIRLTTGEPYSAEILRFFRTREKRR